MSNLSKTHTKETCTANLRRENRDATAVNLPPKIKGLQASPSWPRWELTGKKRKDGCATPR